MIQITMMLTEAADKLFADLCTRQVLDAAESAFPQGLWTQAEAAGLPAMLAQERDGGIAASFADAVAVLRVAGRYSVPLPLAETMVARWLLSVAGLPPIEGPLALALGKKWRLEGAGSKRKLHGMEDAVAWASDAKACVLIMPEGAGIALAVVDPAKLECAARRNIAGEPRDRISANGVAPASVTCVAQISHDRVLSMMALLRAALIVGALEQVLDLSVRYAQERVQFGRPLAKLQAIQQQLAVLAGDAAASSAITDAAAAAADRNDAKLMVAAARARLADAIDSATGIAHQVHGAIGFAREYALHFSTRRLWAWRDEYGTAVEWRECLGRAFVGTPADELWPALSAAGANLAA